MDEEIAKEEGMKSLQFHLPAGLGAKPPQPCQQMGQGGCRPQQGSSAPWAARTCEPAILLLLLPPHAMLASQPESLGGIWEEMGKTATAGRLSEQNMQRKASNN